MAFVIRLGRTAGFLPGELAGLAAASLLVLAYPAVEGPVGLMAAVIVMLLVVRRAVAIGRPDPRIA